MRMARPLAAVLLVAFAGCLGQTGTGDDAVGDDGLERSGAADMPSFEATSTAFEPGDPIPPQYTCDGDNVSPPLQVVGVPPAAGSIALIVGDPDAPIPGIGPFNFTHWVLWNAASDAAGQVVFPEAGVPAGAVEGENGGGSIGWTGPCPPLPLGPHRYVFTFYAVEGTLTLDEGASREELEAALEGRVVDTTTLVGTYDRSPL